MTVLEDHLDALAPPPAPDAPIDPVLGRPVRPAPPARPTFNPDWTAARHRLLDGWVDVQDQLPDTGGIVARAKDHLWVGDPEMDAVVQMFRRLPPRSGRQMFEDALDNGLETIDDPPEELVALFEHIDNSPPWITRERVDRGAIVANSVSPAGKASLIFLNTLVTVQGGSVGGAVGTMGRMQRNMVNRSLETAEFWVHLPAPRVLDRYGIAFKNAVRVRLMHAQARVMLRKKWGRNGSPSTVCRSPMPRCPAASRRSGSPTSCTTSTTVVITTTGTWKTSTSSGRTSVTSWVFERR